MNADTKILRELLDVSFDVRRYDTATWGAREWAEMLGLRYLTQGAIRARGAGDPSLISLVVQFFIAPSGANGIPDTLAYPEAWRSVRASEPDDDGDPGLEIVAIDGRATDERLLADFKLWLRELRSRQGDAAPPRRFSAADFRRWTDNRILAYIDLTLLQKAAGISLPHHVIGELLFPDESGKSDARDTTELVRKTVAPLARELMAKGAASIEALRSQAATGARPERKENVVQLFPERD